GKWLAAATRDGLIQLWPAAKGEQVVTLEKPPQGPAAAAALLEGPIVLAWSPGSKLLAYSTRHDTSIQIWDADSRQKLQPLKGDGKPLRSLAWNPDGKRLASAGDTAAGEAGMVKIWDVKGGKAIWEFPYLATLEPGRSMPKSNVSSNLSWCSDGKRLAVAG